MLAWNRICCAVDFSENARDALEVAADFARRIGIPLTLLHVWQTPVLFVPEGALFGPPDYWESAFQRAGDTLEEWRKDAVTKGAPGAVAVRREGVVFQEIVDYCEKEKMDLLVVGTHGRTGPKRVLIGSVAERVIRHAPCPVLAVRQKKI